jgi:hypothetical protein
VATLTTTNKHESPGKSNGQSHFFSFATHQQLKKLALYIFGANYHTLVIQV